MRSDAPEILARIQDYLLKGGLFNPEAMEHDKVRDLLVDCRTHIEKMNQRLSATDSAVELAELEIHKLKADLKAHHDSSQNGEILEALRLARNILADCGHQDTENYPTFQFVCRVLAARLR